MTELMNKTVGQMFDDTVSKFPHNQAAKYIEMDFDMTYSELSHEVDTFAKSLLALGFKKGDHVAVWATNYPQWLVLMLATAKVGIVLVTVNTSYKTAEFKYLMNQSESKGLFVCDGLKDIDCEQTIYNLCPEMESQEEGRLDLKELPFLTCVVSFDNKYPGMYSWNEIRKYSREISHQEYQKAKDACHPDDVINMQYTSGTTGFPKGVMLTHNNIVNNGKTIGDCMGFTEKDRLCIQVPFFHCFGLVLAIMASLTHGTTMIPLLYFTPMKAMHVIHYEKCTAIHGVPTMFIAMLEHRDFKKYNFSSLRTGIMAGSPCPVDIMKRVVDEMNMSEITITYGQTEASPGCTQTTIHDSLEKRVETVGRAFPFVETKIVDPETGVELGAGEPGEFCARGYNIMKGYYNMPEATAQAIDADGWLHTGDIATVDEEGYYRITGRLKDMIIRGGENIYPKEIEEFIYSIPGVQDVQVVGMKSEKYGEEVAAFVIPKKGENITSADIKHYVGENMARHKIPTLVHMTDKFPMTASGKIQKFILRELADELYSKGVR
ncbi:MAG: AMP-binding protein [Bacillota bacterium]